MHRAPSTNMQKCSSPRDCLLQSGQKRKNTHLCYMPGRYCNVGLSSWSKQGIPQTVPHSMTLRHECSRSLVQLHELIDCAVQGLAPLFHLQSFFNPVQQHAGVVVHNFIVGILVRVVCELSQRWLHDRPHLLEQGCKLWQCCWISFNLRST